GPRQPPGPRHALRADARRRARRPLGERQGRRPRCRRGAEGLGHPGGQGHGPRGRQGVGVAMRVSRLIPVLVLVLAACRTSSPPPSGGLAGAELAAAGGTPRRLVTRPLLGTSTRSLLLDPFVTSDASWGHFVGLLLPTRNGKHHAFLPERSFVSLSPAGVSSPVATLPTFRSLDRDATSLAVVAPFPGGSDPFAARIHVSAGDADGKPVDFDTVASALTVALLPNDQPAHTYPLGRDASPAQTLGGRQWV